jgi:hypothetical protein
MSKTPPWILVALFALSAAHAESPGARALGLGREAVARGAVEVGIAKLAEAAALLDPEREREALAEAYFELGLAYAGRGDSDEAALAALARSASLAARPGNAYLWAASVAGRLGRDAEAETLQGAGDGGVDVAHRRRSSRGHSGARGDSGARGGPDARGGSSGPG